ncbi:hypothetical protein FQA39_LY07931 [Lamprigera yunnana]|nr:hypothetical protein FQA39_LY07931 [Lamprigera yunnana]
MMVDIDKETYASEDVLLVESDNETMPEELFVDTIMPSISLQPLEATKDWSEYSPRMLKSTKHKALKLKRKTVDKDDTDDLKNKLVKLKVEFNCSYYTREFCNFIKIVSCLLYFLMT